MESRKLRIKDTELSYAQGDIFNGKTGAPVSFEALVEDLAKVRIVYVGESHTDPAHHDVQLQVIRALAHRHPDMIVGMEMFDPTYQSRLDLWSQGKLDQKTFLEQVHWQANWRFDFNLYKDILNFVKENHLKLVALNIPFHIPRKIRYGGIDSLTDADRPHVARSIDTTQAAHRAHVENVFKKHTFHIRTNFEYFYAAQCAWDDTMARNIAKNLGDSVMVVIAGRDHIARYFGIPDRAMRRTGVPFRTLIPASEGTTIERAIADYVWVTKATSMSGP